MLDVLRLGAHQLLAMRVPDHAAVSATVELARAVLGDGRSKFVNAVLRKVAARDLDALARPSSPLTPPTDPVGHLAAATRTPVDRRGASPSRWGSTRSTPTASLSSRRWPPTTSAPPSPSSPGRAGPTAEDLLAVEGAAPVGGRRYAVRPRRWRRPGGASRRPAGRAGVQDEGSQLVALAAAAAPARRRLRPAGSTCAPARAARPRCSPGSPSARGARLTANEVPPHRAELVRRAVAGHAEVTVADGRAGPWDAAVASTGSSSTRRAPGWARCAAGPRCAGGASRRRRPARGAAARAAGRGAGGRTPRRASSSTPPARRSLAETREVVDAVLAGRSDPSGSTPALRLCGRRPRRSPTSATDRTSSSGRTCTAPTRCTSPCCSVADLSGCQAVRRGPGPCPPAWPRRDGRRRAVRRLRGPQPVPRRRGRG